MDHTVKCLEEQQDEFDFKYQTHKMEGASLCLSAPSQSFIVLLLAVLILLIFCSPYVIFVVWWSSNR